MTRTLLLIALTTFLPLLSVSAAAAEHVVEVNLEAKVARVTYAPGQEVEAWTYNGDIPGPLIRATVGDRLIVHFKNSLPQPTTVHWHGVRVPIQMDGVPGVSQPEVKTGESFTYDFIVPDAGLFWYHPHVMSALQVGYGLYGALLVDDPNENVGVPDERVLVLSDIAIEDDGSLMSPDGAGAARMVFGLEGNRVLVNGRQQTKLPGRAGVPQRWRIVNTAKTRYFELALDRSESVETPFTVIGRDGGLQEYPTQHNTVLVAPGERVDVIFTPQGKPGGEIAVHSLPHNRGYGSDYLNEEDLFSIALSDLPAGPVTVPPKIRRSIEPINTAGATPVNIDISLVQVNDRIIEYRINNARPSTPLSVKANPGDTQVWTIKNETKWSHPIHLHGFFFQLLDDKGDPVRPLAWRDTVDVPFEKTLRFAVRYDDRAGSWMFHCHILDHAEGGLMGTVDIGPETSSHSHTH